MFGSKKDGLCEQYFPDNDDVIAAVRKWIASAGADFDKRSMQTFVHCIAISGDYVEQ
jgi:hypothetical protein